VLRDLWRQLLGAGRELGIPVHGVAADAAYEPEIYRRVYESLLRHRHVEVLTLDTVLPTEHFSVYDFAVSHREVVPGPGEAESAFAQLEACRRQRTALAAEMERWWLV
jgi:hypothetical protein